MVSGDGFREHREQRGANGNPDYAEWQLVQAIGVIEVGDRAGVEERGEDEVGEQVNMHHARANDSGATPGQGFLMLGDKRGSLICKRKPPL